MKMKILALIFFCCAGALMSAGAAAQQHDASGRAQCARDPSSRCINRVVGAEVAMCGLDMVSICGMIRPRGENLVRAQNEIRACHSKSVEVARVEAAGSKEWGSEEMQRRLTHVVDMSVDLGMAAASYAEVCSRDAEANYKVRKAAVMQLFDSLPPK